MPDTGSIFDGYQKMLDEGLTGIPVAKKDNTFSGLVTIKDLSHVLINENADDLYTSYDNILHVLKGEEVYRCSDEIIGRLNESKGVNGSDWTFVGDVDGQKFVNENGKYILIK